jgi:hypothetical protein
MEDHSDEIIPLDEEHNAPANAQGTPVSTSKKFRSPYILNRRIHAIIKFVKVIFVIFLGAMLGWGLVDPEIGRAVTDTEAWYGYVLILYFLYSIGTFVRLFRWETGRILYLTTGVVYVLSVKYPAFYEALGELVKTISTLI